MALLPAPLHLIATLIKRLIDITQSFDQHSLLLVFLDQRMKPILANHISAAVPLKLGPKLSYNAAVEKPVEHLKPPFLHLSSMQELLRNAA